MNITAIRHARVPLEGKVSNASISFDKHDVSLVAVITDKMRDGRPIVGLGFNSIGRYAQQGIIEQRILPRLGHGAALSLGENGFDCVEVARLAMRDEKPGGHGDRASAIAAVELAFWDLNAKLADEPAYITIARHFGTTPLRAVPVYAAGGYYYSDEGPKRLQDELRSYQDQGFQAFKIKIGGLPLADDRLRVDAALEIAGEGGRLAVDANGRFDQETALQYGRALQPLGLRWYEEIGDPLDYALNARMTRSYPGAIATGENLFSSQDVNNLIQFGGMRPGLDIFQMDAGLSYGLIEYGRMISLLEQGGFDRNCVMPHGGHQINLHIVTALNLGGCEAYPSVFKPFGGYTPGCEIADGMIRPDDAIGFGLEDLPGLRSFIDELVS